MTSTNHDNLEMRLAELTASRPTPDALWRRAATDSGMARASRRSWAETFAAPLPNGVLGVVAVVLFAAITVGVLLPSLGSARRASVGLAVPQFSERAFVGESLRSSESPASTPARSPASDRRVVQRGTIEVRVTDVTSTFARLHSLLSPVGGEYVEQSSLSGAGASTVGTATLRVGASRLGVVQAAVAEWGTVVSQTSAGEDVTDQAVDLESRLTVERRVERELLELLESRRGSPLKEILEVREQLNTVRTQIERLTAQQARLNSQVSLATLTVTLRGAEQPDPPKGLLDYASQTLRVTWKRALSTAIDSVAWILGVLVGGIVFWIALAVLVLLGYRLYRRSTAAAAHEPPPRLDA